jgi:tetratricopeptide (TPR) repeat protein
MRGFVYVSTGILWAWSALAFANVPLGAVVDNAVLPALTGGQQSFLSDTNVSVFIFFKPGLEHSNRALVQIAQCQQELADRPVHWCAIVSDRSTKAEVEATVAATGLKMPVLIDTGDALYGRLGVVLHPVIGVTDEQRRLVAYQPFAKVNYHAFMKAQVQHALKEINDAELDVAHRFFRLAEKQFQMTNYVQALANVGKSLDKNPTADAWSLRGRILLVESNRVDAAAAFTAALKLDPQNAAAQAGLKACQEDGK